MIAPLSWLKEYIDITLKSGVLGEKLTEIGLGTEKIRHENNDTIFDLEITPNRPDWLSIIGVAREIAAIENKKVTYPKLKTDLKPTKSTKILPFTIHPNFVCSPRMTGIVISGITVKESPQWLQDRLTSIGLRPINNIVDITNYVMWELGNPIHSFDYDKIAGHVLKVKQTKGGEVFESVDEISYHLPKGAIVYEDSEKIFDLSGIKGGKNSGTYKDTKNVFILVPVDNPVLIRKASVALGLRSDASAIFERAVNKGGTLEALKRTVDLVLETAGGEIASELMDIKEQDFKPWKLDLRLERLEFILGIKIPEKEVVSLLERLHLEPTLIHHSGKRSASRIKEESWTSQDDSIIECTIPTYRNDLQIEEDLIEEVARMYGYNNFPKTMPIGQIPTIRVPYFRDYRKDERVKQYFASVGFSEIYSYSLISEKDLENVGINSENVLRVDNPVSRDFEYLRPNLKINLLKSLRQNTANFPEVNLFELGKVYLGTSLDKTEETYHLSGIANIKTYYEIKGIIEELFEKLGINENASDYIEVLDEGVYFDIPYSHLLEKAEPQKVFAPLPKYPTIAEDIAVIVEPDVRIGDMIHEIKKQSPLISLVELLDMYGNTRTFHIVYLDKKKNLTTGEVTKVREEIIVALSKKFAAKIK